MDPDSIRSILLMLVLVALSGYFSATETAFSTFNRIRLKGMAENGHTFAQAPHSTHFDLSMCAT